MENIRYKPSTPTERANSPGTQPAGNFGQQTTKAFLNVGDFISQIGGKDSPIQWIKSRQAVTAHDVPAPTNNQTLAVEVGDAPPHIGRAITDVCAKMGESPENLQLKPFRGVFFFNTSTDKSILDPKLGEYAGIMPDGRQLVANFYKQKFGAEIIFPKGKFGDLDDYEFAFEVGKHLAPLRARPGDVTCTFLCGNSKTHAYPVTYIRENEEEAILISDSRGANEGVVSELAKSGIPVFKTEGAFQRDSVSCYSVALLVGKILTQRNEDGSYKVKGLVHRLKESAEARGDHFAAKMPKELLVLPQLREFYEKNKPSQVDETLEQHRERYAKPADVKDKTTGAIKSVMVADYLRLKGLKFRGEVIPMQYYREALSAAFGDRWTPEVDKLFVAKVKEYRSSST